MKTIEEQGKTVDDAIRKALETLQVSREQVSVEILDEGSRGLFGFMGAKPAKIRVSISQETTYNSIKEELQSVHQQEQPLYKDNASPAPASEEAPVREQKKPAANVVLDEANVVRIVDAAKVALKEILGHLDIEYTVEVKRRDDQILLNIHCENENFLIGRRGTTLDAIQYLVNRIANKQTEEKVQVVLDTSNYRVNRKQRLQRLAVRLSRRVKTTGKPITVAPMNPHDRRIIHLALQDDPAVKTLSRGSGFLRRVIISSNRNNSNHQRKN